MSERTKADCNGANDLWNISQLRNLQYGPNKRKYRFRPRCEKFLKFGLQRSPKRHYFWRGLDGHLGPYPLWMLKYVVKPLENNDSNNQKKIAQIPYLSKVFAHKLFAQAIWAKKYLRPALWKFLKKTLKRPWILIEEVRGNPVLPSSLFSKSFSFRKIPVSTTLENRISALNNWSIKRCSNVLILHLAVPIFSLT